jgi:ABC-type nitrate/sulfonate/bicarbonate transport system substrate-binding protein
MKFTRISIAVVALLSMSAARAEDLIKIAIGQRGVFENCISEIGQDRGFFKKYGLKLEILYTQGGGETLQAILSHSVDMGIVGTLQTMGAYAKGAPLRAIGATMRGAYEYWYVPTESPIKSFKDAAGKSVAFSTRGSSNNLMVLGLARLYGVEINPVATGSPAPTFIQTMSGQVDMGWSIPPFNMDALEEGKIRIVARGSEVKEYADQTVRFLGVNAAALKERPDVFRRYMQAYREVLEWLYSSSDAMKDYAKWAGTTETVSRRVRDEFVLKENAQPDVIVGLDLAMTDAIAFKILAKPLTPEQLKDMIQLQEPIK